MIALNLDLSWPMGIVAVDQNLISDWAYQGIQKLDLEWDYELDGTFAHSWIANIKVCVRGNASLVSW